MDILDIDAVNFAGRVGHVAAAELAGLLTHGEISPMQDWFLREPATEEADLGAAVDQMAGYVVRRLCTGETLFRHLDVGEWDEAPLALRAAFEVFASTVASVGSKLLQDQRAAEAAMELATRPSPKPVAVEDTIFEKEESLGAMRPEAQASAVQVAERDRQLKAEARARRKAEQAAKKAEAARETDAKATASSVPAVPMSVGEAPAKPPVNRGGRGKKKAT